MAFFTSTVRVGNMAPDFTLPDEDAIKRTLSFYRGFPVVLYFYPSDGTPRCTKQACSLRDTFSEFQELSAIILGINYETPESHKAFKTQYNLPFTLLSDCNKEVARKYGVNRWWWLPVPKRVTFIIDKEGIVRNIIPDVDVATHTEKVLQMLKAIA